jgi:endonuclease-3
VESAEERIDKILRILHKEYPRSQTALHFKTPLQILVATILSAQCTDERVNKITPALFEKYPTATDFADADPDELQEDIRSTGFFRSKSKSIIGASRTIIENFGGKVPDSMEELLTLPGVARKTANIVLSSGYKKTEGIAVDTHVKRLAGRLGLSQKKNPDKIEQDLMALVPKENWLDFNYMLVNHGRKVCQARNPNCPQCGLKSICPSAVEFFPDL